MIGYSETSPPVQVNPENQIAAADADWNGWENNEEEEDVFGHIMTPHAPVFIDVSWKIEGDGEDKTVVLELVSAIPDWNEYPDAKTVEAWAHVTADNGKTWRHETLASEGRKEVITTPRVCRKKKVLFIKTKNCTPEEKTFSEKWTGKIKWKDIVREEGTPVALYFSAKDSEGNITTELPLSSPGWPPDVRKYFPAARDEDNSADMVESSLDLLDSYISRDEKNIYLAVRAEGNISAGTLSPVYLPIYTAKFTVPEDQGEGLMVGRQLFYSPLHFFPYEPIDLGKVMFSEEGYSKRIVDFCANIFPGASERAVGINGNTLYMKIPLAEICGKECNELRMLVYTVANTSTDIIAPIPINSSPYTRIYLRTHEIEEGNTSAGISGFDNLALLPPVGIAPGPGDGVFDYQNLYKDSEVREKLKTEYIGWMKAFGAPEGFESRLGNIHSGQGPFRISSCDTVLYGRLRFEVYEREGRKKNGKRLKARIYKNEELVHTIMAGPGTTQARDGVYNSPVGAVTLSNFSDNPLSCDFEIK